MFSYSWFGDTEDLYVLLLEGNKEEELYKSPPPEPMPVKIEGLKDLNSLVNSQTKLILTLSIIFVFIYLLGK